MYDFLGDANLHDDKPIKDWGEAEFRTIFESIQRVFGADIAWQLLYRLIQLRAGEINEVQFNGAGNPLEAMSMHPEGADLKEGAPEEFMEGLMEELMDNMSAEELSEEELEELLGEDYDYEDFDDDGDADDEDDDDDDDYRDRYGNAGRFF